jgi:hypothetical protein
MANPNNVIHRRRAGRNSVKEARRTESGTATAAPVKPATGGDPIPAPKPRKSRKRKTLYKKKEK